MILTETYDADALESLLRHKGITEKEKALLRRYKKRTHNGNKVFCEYEFGKEWKKFEKGRLYCPTSLQSFSREVRACLARKHYFDIDLKNAQPVILYHIAKKNGWECNVLKEFIDNREEVIESLITSDDLKRSEAKQICISVFFGAIRSQHSILPRLTKELSKISDNLVLQYPELYKHAQRLVRDGRVNYNPKGTLTALIAQDEERMVMESAQEYLTSIKRPFETLIFDGGFVRRISAEERDFPVSILKGMEKAVFDKTGYVVNFEEKPLETTIELTEIEGLVDSNILINDAYACERFVEMVDIRKVGKTIYIFDPKSGRWYGEEGIRQQIAYNKAYLVFKQMTPKGIKIYDYGGDNVNIKAFLTLLPDYIKSGTLPVVFEYTLCDLIATEEQSEEIHKYFNDIINIVCDSDEEKGRYLVSYLAHLIQKPLELPGVGIILSGQEGCGKDTIANFIMKRIVGDCLSFNYNKTAQLFDKHDIGRMNKLVVKLEEANQKICYENQDALKTFITGETQEFNPKFCKNPFTLDNYARWFLSTNYGCPFPITDKDRRIAIFDVSPEKQGDTEYWEDFYRVMDTPLAGKVIGSMLEEIDISNYNPKILFKSEYKEQIQSENTSIEKKFVQDTHDDWNDYLSVADIYIIYKNWCKMNSCEGYAVGGANILGKRFIVLCRDKLLLHKNPQNISMYKQNK
jgi:predicted transcriptional regulator